MTPAAARALVALLRAPDAPDRAAVRLAPGVGAGGEPSIGLMVVPGPQATDVLLDAGHSLKVYVDHAAADMLADQQVDVEIDDERVAFALRRKIDRGSRRLIHRS